MVPSTSVVVVPGVKTIFTGPGAVDVVVMGATVGVAVRVGSSAVALSCGGNGVGLGSGVAVTDWRPGRLQPVNTTSSMASKIVKTDFRNGLHGCLEFMLNNLLMGWLLPNHSTRSLFP